MEELYSTSLLNVEDYESLDECQSAENVYNNGEYIIGQIINGNWTDAVDFLKHLCISPLEFADFVQELEEESGIEQEFLDRQAFVCITQMYYSN